MNNPAPVVTDIKALSGVGSLFDRQANRFGRLGKWGVGIGAVGLLALAAPVIWTAVGAAAGLGILVVGGGTAMAMEKPFTNYLRTKRLEMLMNGAKKRPVETRLMLAADAEARINAQVAAISSFRTSLNNFKMKATQLEAEHPDVASAYRAIAERQAEMLANREEAVRTAQRNLAKYNEGTDKVRDLVQMNEALGDLKKHSDAMGMSFEDKLANDTVIFQVGNDLAESLGAMDQLAFQQSISDLRGSELGKNDSKRLDSVAIAAASVVAPAKTKAVEYVDR